MTGNNVTEKGRIAAEAKAAKRAAALRDNLKRRKQAEINKKDQDVPPDLKK